MAKKGQRNIFSVILSFFMIFALVGCVVVNVSLGSSNNKRPSGSNSSSSSVDFSNLTYCAFGTSITYGIAPSDKVNAVAEPYPQVVGDILNLKQTVNRGVSGSTLVPDPEGRVCLTDRILSVTASYDIITFELGTNDFSLGLPLGEMGDTDKTTVYGALDLIANKCVTDWKDCYCIFMTPLKRSIYLEANSAGYYQREVKDAVIAVALKYNIPYLDLYTLGNFEIEMYTNVSDGTHPTQDFYKNHLAPQIADFIKTNYK